MPPAKGITPPELLPELYAAAARPSEWPVFLAHLARLFDTGTATLRVIDASAPVVHRSFSVGFDPVATRNYVEGHVELDPFRAYLSDLPVGVMGISHDIISDRDYARSAHYHGVFRINGNFYAMGGHVGRVSRHALQIGVHRRHGRGPFSEQERRTLEFFAPHLRQAGELMRTLGRLQTALVQSHDALDTMPLGLWQLNSQLRCRWMNAAAEAAVRAGRYGLGMTRDRFTVDDAEVQAQLRCGLRRIADGRSTCEIIRIDESGAALVLLAHRGYAEVIRFGEDGDGVLVFLLDPGRSTEPDLAALQTLYGLTAAECRFARCFLQGLDLEEISERLGVSLHTARAHVKAVMQKTGTRRQPSLMRALLLGVAALRQLCAGEPEDGHAS